MKSVKEELEHRNLHLLRVVETERTSKWRLEEFTEEQRKQLDALRRDVGTYFILLLDNASGDSSKVSKQNVAIE